MGKIEYSKIGETLINGLTKGGVFLTVKDGEELNTMTIGWATVGNVWSKPILTVYVRYSRHTYRMLERAQNFTVNVPVNNSLLKELAFCGTKSGREFDKFKECNLTAVASNDVDTPSIKECYLNIECEVVYQQAMEPSNIELSIDDRYYQNNDYHVIYYGEIKGCYVSD